MRRRPVSGSDLITKVNVTPIIDVALVLVIILLVTAPLLSVTDNKPVNLPGAHTREAEDERNVSITRATDGSLVVDHESVTRETLVPALRARLAGQGDVLVVVRADAGTPYGEVRELLGAARAAGAKRLAIATRQQTRN